MNIQTIYEQLKNDHLCDSAYDFSENYLGKAKSYYSVLKARNAEPSTDALVMLELSLKEKALVFESDTYEFYSRLRTGLLLMSNEVRDYRDQRCIERLRESQYGVAA